MDTQIRNATTLISYWTNVVNS